MEFLRRILLQFNTFILLYTFSSNLFMDLSLPFCMTTPIGHMEVTDVIHPFYPYVIYG